MGRPKVLTPCEYCHELFGVNELHRHRGKCPTNPNKDRTQGCYTVITCSFCGAESTSKKFQQHLRRECPKSPACGDGERICTFCQIKQPIAKFTSAGKRLDYRCLSCNIRISRNWYHGNRDRAREQMIRWRFGITAEEYRSMLALQGGKCAICNTEPSASAGYNKRNLAVDHDHITGKVRGLLCHNCNNGIGCFRDDRLLLRRAIAYLDQHSEIAD